VLWVCCCIVFGVFFCCFGLDVCVFWVVLVRLVWCCFVLVMICFLVFCFFIFSLVFLWFFFVFFFFVCLFFEFENFFNGVFWRFVCFYVGVRSVRQVGVGVLVSTPPKSK